MVAVAEGGAAAEAEAAGVVVAPVVMEDYLDMEEEEVDMEEVDWAEGGAAAEAEAAGVVALVVVALVVVALVVVALVVVVAAVVMEDLYWADGNILVVIPAHISGVRNWPRANGSTFRPKLRLIK